MREDSLLPWALLQFGPQWARPARDTTTADIFPVIHTAIASPKLGPRLDTLGLLENKEQKRGSMINLCEELERPAWTTEIHKKAKLF